MTWSAAACNLNFSARKLKSTLTTVRHSSPPLTHNIISSVDYRCKQVHSTFTIPSMNTVHLHQKFQHIEYFSDHQSLFGKKSAAASMIKFNHMNVYCTHTEHITNERQTPRGRIYTPTQSPVDRRWNGYVSRTNARWPWKEHTATRWPSHERRHSCTIHSPPETNTRQMNVEEPEYQYVRVSNP